MDNPYQKLIDWNRPAPNTFDLEFFKISSRVFSWEDARNAYEAALEAYEAVDPVFYAAIEELEDQQQTYLKRWQEGLISETVLDKHLTKIEEMIKGRSIEVSRGIAKRRLDQAKQRLDEITARLDAELREARKQRLTARRK